MIRYSKCLGQCNHTRAEPKLNFLPKRSTLVDDECKQPEKVCFSEPVSLVNGGVKSGCAKCRQGRFV
ncbi:unnamed protein product [Hymenolepis diminuta]|uniref:Uncharacterized protein n=1 Tax=Hymenolepis diminuta TaxID=6216 RepID=A0A564Z5Y9_HYMDI|nr:unnamed protein product [Hymenolepis diminuta]